MTCFNFVTVQHMHPSSTDRVKQFRATTGSLRFDNYLSQEAHDAIDAIAAAQNCTRKGAVEHAVMTVAATIEGTTMQPDPTLVSYWSEDNLLTLDAAIAAAPNDKVRKAIREAAAEAANLAQYRRTDSTGSAPHNIPAHERAAFEKLKYQLAEANVTARETMIAGGEAAIAQKARVAESWLHANIHNQGNQE